MIAVGLLHLTPFTAGRGAWGRGGTAMTHLITGHMVFRGQVEAALRHIDPTARVDRHTGQVSVSFDSSPAITDSDGRRHTHGHNLLLRLVRSRHTVMINRLRRPPNYALQTDNAGATNTAVGSGSNVYWDPDFLNQHCTSEGVQESPPYISLAHELIHADWMRRGRYRPEDVRGSERVGVDAGAPRVSLRVERLDVGLYYRDRRATERTLAATYPVERPRSDDITENQLRGECGLPDRTQYAAPTARNECLGDLVGPLPP